MKSFYFAESDTSTPEVADFEAVDGSEAADEVSFRP